MPDEHRTTTNRRRGKSGLVAIRIGPRVYWVPSALARRIERLVSKAEQLGNQTGTPELRTFRRMRA